MLSWMQSVVNAVIALEVSDKIALANCIFTFFFLLATIISVICAFKAYDHQKNRARKEAACDLAKYYAENIIPRNSFVSAVMQLSKLEDKAKDIFPYDELSKFNRGEMMEFLEKKSVSYEEIKAAFLYPDPESILKIMLLRTESVQERQTLLMEYIIPDLEEGKGEINNRNLLQYSFVTKAHSFLNDLEWFSMSCRYGVADEEILYQSLHQTFLSSVWLLYFYICDQNLTNEGKLFTNIIWLFDQWRSRLMNIEREAQKKQAQAQKELEAAEHQRMIAEKKLQEAQPKVYEGKSLKK